MKAIKDLKLKEKKEIFEMDIKKIQAEIVSSSKKMFELLGKLQGSELKQTHLVKVLRRYIASLKTHLTAKKDI